MQKLNLEFSPSQVLKSATMNTITQKIDEAIDEINTLPEIKASVEEVEIKIQSIKDSVVYLPQSLFDELEKKGELDATKEYNTYEG